MLKTTKISGCIGRPSVVGEIWGPDLTLLNLAFLR